jgi:hypothetical protein
MTRCRACGASLADRGRCEETESTAETLPEWADEPTAQSGAPEWLLVRSRRVAMRNGL